MLPNLREVAVKLAGPVKQMARARNKQDSSRLRTSTSIRRFDVKPKVRWRLLSKGQRNGNSQKAISNNILRQAQLSESELAIEPFDAEHAYRKLNPVICDWQGSAVHSETTFHQLSPYIGKVKSSMAASLVSQFTKSGQVVYDPFSGSGTIPLEAWIAGRGAIANDLNPYARLLTKAKLFPYMSLDAALGDIERVADQAQELSRHVDLRTVPHWVRAFFHPESLREVVSWSEVLSTKRRHFLLACLLGILHHQRPGFMSYPSSHAVPYLRAKKFPRNRFPALYNYRCLRDRLEAKVRRALKRPPQLNFNLERRFFSTDAAQLQPGVPVDAIITSPPYMRRLDYGRDNRLRLWFLGTEDWHELDRRVTPNEEEFVKLMRRCLRCWRQVLAPGGRCVLVLGDTYSRLYDATLPDALAKIAREEIGGYKVISKYTEEIPDARRVRRGLSGSEFETVLALERMR